MATYACRPRWRSSWGWSWSLIELADGTRKRELVFTGKGIFGDQVQTVEIILTEARDTLMGTRLLAEKILEIDFAKRTLEIR